MVRFLVHAVVALTIVGDISHASSPPNGVGVYFDPAAQYNCLPDSTGAVLSGYLLLDNPTESSVASWEGSLFSDAVVFLFGYAYPSAAINLASPPDFVVSYASPVATHHNTILLQFSVFTSIGGAIFFEPIEGRPFAWYIPGSEPDVSVPMFPEYGGFGGPVATVGLVECPPENPYDGEGGYVTSDTWNSHFRRAGGLACTVVTEQTTWSEIKAMFTR